MFESENATLCITFDSNFSTNFNIDVRLLLNNNITFSNLTLSNPMFSNPCKSIYSLFYEIRHTFSIDFN